MFQPREEPSQENNEEQEANTKWCLSCACAPMPVAEECYCCEELEELNQKFDNSGLYL